MVKIIKFTDATSDTDIFINAEKVVQVYAAPNGGVMVYFDDGTSVLLTGHPEDVVKKLNA